VNGIAYYTFLAKVSDLPKHSTVVITRICDECGKIDFLQYSDRGTTGKCFECSRSKPTGHNYARCCECGKSLYYHITTPTKCQKCFNKSITNEYKYPTEESRQEMLNNSKNTHKMDIFNWSRFVRDRDNYTCQVCGNDTDKMDAHHLFDKTEYPQLVLELSNGVCMCKSCHSKLHNHHQNSAPVTPIDFIRFLKRYQHEHS